MIEYSPETYFNEYCISLMLNKKGDGLGDMSECDSMDAT